MMPKVSVLVFTYNHERFVRDTLASVLGQDFADYEIVVTDDGSTDDTPRIVAEIAAEHPERFTLVLNEENRGITANCNAGLSACRGELVATIGGDDLLLPGKLTAQAAAFDADPDLALAYHAVEVFDSDSGEVLYTTFENPEDRVEGVEDIIAGLGIPGACSVMARRSKIPAHGFEPRLPMVSDWLFMIELALRGGVAFVPGVYGRYRKHGAGTTQRIDRYLEETLETLSIVRERYPERADLEPYLIRGEARYLAGEAFRRLEFDPASARELARRAHELEPGSRNYKLVYAVSRTPFLARPMGIVLNRGRYAIKRRLGSLWRG